MSLFDFFVRHQKPLQPHIRVTRERPYSLQLSLDTKDDRSFYLSEWEDFDHDELLSE